MYNLGKQKVGETIVICNLKTYMDREGLNITQLSEKVGIAPNTIRSYLKGKFSRIDCETAIKFCKFFQVSFGDMFEMSA